MIHGKDISIYTPKINYKGLIINKVNKVSNPNYLFIDLTISPQTKAGNVEIVFENKSKTSFSYTYKLLKRQKSSSERVGFNTSDVMYLITPDRFANGKLENDNVISYKDSLDRKSLTGRHGGDIEGIVQHLDYIQNLGMTALWINPMLENNQPKTSYHGYAITNFSKTDPRFGSNEGYVRLNGDDKIWEQGLSKIYQTLSNDFLYANPNDLVIFPDNHDMSRLYTQLHEDYDKFKMGMAFLLTTGGIPQIYYGTEILVTNPKSEEHGEIRSDMPGGWIGDVKNIFTNTGLNSKEKEAQEFITNLLQWRKSTPVIHTGKLKHFASTDGTYVQFRYDDKQKVMVVLNKNKEAKALDLSQFKEIIEPIFKAKDIINNKNLKVKNTLNLEPNSVLILEIF